MWRPSSGKILDAGDGRGADTIFFGGGTPSLLDPAEVRRLVEACRRGYGLTPDAEITLEANPESVTPEKLDGFLAAGVNRLSLGVQSFDDDELRRLGRLHSAARAAEALAEARAAGFSNISLDLMCWLPGQSLNSWRRTVDRAIELGPDHLSLYLLEIYPNAPLKDAMARGSGSADWAQTPEDEAADMYLDGLAALDRAGYEQYEISNVARNERASRHNLKYWRGGLLARLRLRGPLDGGRDSVEKYQLDGRLRGAGWTGWGRQLGPDPTFGIRTDERNLLHGPATRRGD